MSSIQNVMAVLRWSEEMSSLAVSVHKSSFFSASLSDGEMSQISLNTGISLGSSTLYQKGQYAKL